MMAARRAGGVDGNEGGGDSTTAHSNSCPPLPVIRQPQSTTLSACDASPISHVSSTSHQCDVAVLKSSSKALLSTPYVITDKTPRAELLAIIMQLQADLTQRTDSVNAIQRNFERLSAMHHAEQLELRRLRLLEKAQRGAEVNDNEATIRQLESAVADMRCKALEEQATGAQLEAKLQAAKSSCELQHDITGLITLHAAGFREVLQAEAAAFLQFHAFAIAERAAIDARHEALRQQLLCSDVAQLVADHHAQIVPYLVPGGVTDSHRLLETSAQASTATIVELVHPWLCEVAEATRQYVAAAQVADQQRALTEAEIQRNREELKHTLGEMLHLRLRAIEEEEQTGRSALLFGALQVRAVAEGTFDVVRLLRATAEAAATVAHSSWEVTAALHARRVSDWCDAADARLVDLCNAVEISMAEKSRECDGWRQKAAQELLLGERKRLQDLHESQVQAMRDDWTRQKSAAQRTHEMQLAQVRTDLEGRIKVAEERRVTAERQTGTSEAALIQVKRDHAAEVQSVETYWRSAISDAVGDCEQRWMKMCEEYQERQQACARAMLQLLLDHVCTRGHCVCQEEEARADVCRTHWKNRTQQLQSEQAATVQRCVTAAVLLERVRRHVQDEDANRAVLCASAAADWTALVSREAVHKAEAHHVLSMRAAADRLEGVRAEAAERDDKWRQRLDALEADVGQAKEERLGAVVAAREAQAALQATQRDFTVYRSSVTAAARCIEVAESATESACCCPLCLELYSQPVACVPCGHIYCSSCLLRHPRNSELSSLTSSFTSAGGASTGETSAVGARAELEVAQWLRKRFTPCTCLFCPECASATVSTVVELQALGELTAKYDYKKRGIAVLLAELR
ncbi:Zinc finger, C3HC4 type (RING finger) containing protein, putative [Leishmania guyanensis]